MTHRNEIVEVVDANIIFLSKNSRDAIEELLNQMGTACSVELRIAIDGKDNKDKSEMYEKLGEKTEELIELLYKDLNLV